MKRAYLWIVIVCMAVLTACGEQKESSSEPGVSASPSPVETEAVQLPDVKEEPPLVLKDFPSKEDIVFTEGKHNRNDALVRTFKTYEYRLGETVFQVENTYSEDEAIEMIWQIIQMVKDTEQWMDVKVQPIGRIVVIQPDVGIKNSLYSADAATVYIHPESLQSGSYVGALYEAAYPQITEVWMRQGLGFLVQQYADNGTNRDSFRETIADFNEPDMLSLFGVYYYDFINDRETIQKAQSAAASVLLFAEEKYGREKMLAWLCGDSEHTNLAIYNDWIAQDWLEAIAEQTKHPLWEGIGYGFSDYYDIIIYMGEYDYQIVWTPEEAVDLHSTSGVAQYVANASVVVENVRDYLEVEVAKSGNVIDKSYFHIVINEADSDHGEGSGVTRPLEREIALRKRPSFPLAHELTHLFTGCIGHQWNAEGFADYVIHEVFPEAFMQDGYMGYPLCDLRYVSMNENHKHVNEHERCIYAEEYFARHGFVHNDVSTFDPLVWREGYAYGKIMENDGDLSKVIKETGGFDTTYEAYLCFTNYLIEKTSVADFLKVLYDETLFEEVFGADFETLRAEWAEELLSKY